MAPVVLAAAGALGSGLLSAAVTGAALNLSAIASAPGSIGGLAFARILRVGKA